MKRLWLFTIGVVLTVGELIAQNGLVAYYPFNGNANDESGNNYYGDTTGHAPELATDRFGDPNSAFSFDGVDDFIDVPFEPELRLETPFSVAIWVNISQDISQGGLVIGKNASYQGHRNYSILITSDHRVSFIYHQDAYTSIELAHDIPVDLEEWHHILVIHDNTENKLYINNTLVQSNSVSNSNVLLTYLASPQNLAIGRHNYNGPDPGYFSGLLDDIHIYNRALSVTEIDSLYHEGGWDISAPLTFTQFLGGAIVEDGGSTTGVSWVDYNNDGLLDLFAANGGNNFLYTNNGDGTFTKVTSGSIVTDNAGSIGGTWGDYDNDGDLDLYIVNESSQTNNLYMNNGDGSFTKVTTGTLVNESVTSYGAAWADYDNDGDLDLFVANIGLNSLFNNDGAGNFTPVENDPVVTDGPETHSLNGAWGDYNRDGYLDLFVGNGGESGNYLYTNDGDGTFTKVTSGPVVNDGSTYCGAWADYNNDGFLDLFATKAQNFSPSLNNYLYKNNGDGTFTKITAGTIVTDGGWSHGCGWADYDNDGYVDLFVANFNYDGNFSYENFLYRNNGDETFSRVYPGQVVSDSSDSRGVGWGDYDSDGDLDLFIGNAPQNNILYINEGNGNNWINIHPIGTISNTSAIGAKVWVKASINSVPIWQLREISSCTGYGSQNSLDSEFGLGDASIIDSIRIEWPSGIIWDTTAVQVNQFLTIFEHNEISYGLIAYYPFNGNANDESGNGNDGDTLGHAPTLITDRFGNENSAYHFNSTDAYIQVPHFPALDSMSQITVSLWIKPESEAPYYFPYHIIEKYGSWDLGQRDRDVRWGLYSIDSDIDNWTIGLELEAYYHVAMTYNGVEMRIYVNNTLETTLGLTGPISPSNYDIYIGEYTFGGDYYFDGIIDDIRIYDYALSESELQSLYHEGDWPVLNQNNLVLNSGFEEGLNSWNPYQNAAGWNATIVDPHSGDNCLVFNFPSGGGYYDAGIKQEGDHLYIEAGVPYYFSYWRKDLNTHDTHTASETILDTDIRIDGVNYTHPMPDMSPSETWKHIDTTIIFPVSGYAELDFQIHGYATSDSALFALDDVIIRQITENLMISLPQFNAIALDTIIVPVSVSLSESLFDSAELHFSGYHYGLEYLGIDTWGTMIDGLGWTWSENETDTLLFTAFAGSNNISGNGVFCNLRFLVTGDFCTEVPIEIAYAKFNSTELTEIVNGSVFVKPNSFYGDVDSNGDIEAHDAALILKHITHGGEDSLNCQAIANADVNQSDEIEALDASIILQFVVQLIDSLPVEPDSPTLLASGDVSMENVSVIAGNDFELPLFLENGDNILSFEGRLEYNPSDISLQAIPIIWSELLSGFTIEIDTEEIGVIIFAGASANPDGASGVFATLMFTSDDEFGEDDITNITITSMRFNGNIHHEDIVSQVNGVVGVDDPTLPTQYSLVQNYPNPFNPITTIKYGIPEDVSVTILVFDITGREVIQLEKSSHKAAGYYEIQWGGIDNSNHSVGTGLYFTRIEAGDYTKTIKMLYLK